MKENVKYVNCAHCGARVRKDVAVDHKHNLIYSEHYHCRECDPDGDWDCLSYELDGELH